MVAPGHALDRPSAANAGLEAASGEWIGFLDEDDWFEPRHLSRLLAVAERAGAQLLYGDTVVHGSADEVLQGLGYWKQRFTERPSMHISAILVARDLVAVHGCRFDPRFVLLEDWDFLVQCAEFTDFLHVPGISSHYDAAAGTSGGGDGRNRDDERLRPYIALMTEKWGERYGAIGAEVAQLQQRAAAAMADGKDDDAIVLLRAALQTDPGNPLLLNRLAVCLRRRDELPGALMALRRACDSDPQAYPILSDRVVLEHDLGFIDNAREGFLRLFRLVGSEREWQRTKAIAAHIGADIDMQ